MKHLFISFILFSVLHSLNAQNQEVAPDCISSGINISENAGKIDALDLLKLYHDFDIYRILLENEDNQALQFGPSRIDIKNVFGKEIPDGDTYCLKDLPGLNFAAIVALEKLSTELLEKQEELEENQRFFEQQAIDMNALHNQLLEISGIMEELKIKNEELQNSIDELRMSNDLKNNE